ncbi:MAG: response regulator [Ignavibacteriales bacterium]|nr:response regulator [Ignavibacteriales bacterium]
MNERILVVDDEESLRLSLKFKLKSAGFDVDTAIDGEEALEKLKAKPADVVLLDINMPRMSGIEALTIIRQTYPHTEAIMLTGFADFSTAIECLKIGAKDYLVKPVDTTELVTRLRSLVRSRSTERALQDVHQEYLGYLSEDLIDPLKKIETMLEQVSKLPADAEKERKKALTGVRDLVEKLNGKLLLVAEVAKSAAEGGASGEEDVSPSQFTEKLREIRKGSAR